MKRFPVKNLCPLLLLCLAAGVSACGPPPPEPDNLLLITIDTLRPDRLGFARSDRSTSPAIDRLASEGIVFRRAYSQGGWTLPSMASIFTGHYASRHGATKVERSIDTELPTLAAVLQASGFQTSAFISHVMLSPERGFADGFDLFDDSVLGSDHPHRASTSIRLTDRVLANLPSPERPFFVWVHYFDPHFEYLVRPEWNDWGASQLDRYDAEIAHTDQQLGRLIEGFEEAGLMERTVTVVTADHGEAFGEKGTWRHVSSYEEVLRVPLIFHGSGLRSGTLGEPAQQIDLMPTLLNLLAVEPPEGLPGLDILSDPLPEADVFVERQRPRPFIQQTLIRGRYKLIRISATPDAENDTERLSRVFKRTGLKPGLYLYDLEDDPGESRNLYSPTDPNAAELLAALNLYTGDQSQAADTLSIDEETRAKLRALGYLE